jgi:toxin FitB
VNVVDSSGWLEFFTGGPNANYFAPAISDTQTLVVPTICLYEVFKRLLMQRGEEVALQSAGIMSLGKVADLTQEIAVNAAALAIRYQLAMADSMIFATAQAYSATLWTQDIDFAKMDGVRYVKA